MTWPSFAQSCRVISRWKDHALEGKESPWKKGAKYVAGSIVVF